jgi:integrase
MSFLTELSKRNLKIKVDKDTNVNNGSLINDNKIFKIKNDNTFKKNNDNNILKNNNSFFKKISEFKKEDQNLNKKIIKKSLNKINKKEIIHNFALKILDILKSPYENKEITKTDVNKIFNEVKKELDIKKVKKDVTKTEKVPSPNKKINDMLNQEDIQKIMSEAKKLGLMHEIIVDLFFKLGMKLFEIAELKIDDINFNEGKININRHIYDLDSASVAKILAYIGSRTTGVLIQDNNNNNNLSKDDLLGFIKKIMDAAEVKKNENIESLVEKFVKSLRKQGKPYMYWEYIDKVVEIRNQSNK